MVKKMYIGYSGITGQIYINEHGEAYLDKNVRLVAPSKKDDVRSIDMGLEKVIRILGADLGKRKVTLFLDEYYKNIGSHIEGYLKRYVKKIDSKQYVSDSQIKSQS